MPAPYRDTLPKIVWDETTSAKTPVGGWLANELSIGWFARGWALYETRTGGPFLPFFGAPEVQPPTAFGPMPPDADNCSAFDVSGGKGDRPLTDWAVLGGWVYPGSKICSELRTSWAQKTFTGLTPGLTVGFRFAFGYVLDTGGGNVFGEIEGTFVNRFSALSSGPTFWTFDGKPVVEGGYIATVVPPSGEVIIRLGWENMGPSGANGQGSFSAFELVDLSCEAAVTTHRLDFRYPLEEVRVWRGPRAGSSRVVYPSGAEASWRRGLDGHLAGEVRWVPRATSVDPLNDGWEDAADVKGWQRFLAWARRGGNTFRFHPDKDDDDLFYECVLVEPRGDPEPEDDMTRGFPFHIRTVDGAAILGY